MAIDITSLVHNLGINVGNTDDHATNHVANAGAKAPKPATGVGAFAGHIAGSIASIGGSVIGGLANSVAKGVSDTAQGFSQGINFGGLHGSIVQNQQFRAKAMADIERAQHAYTKQYSEGKISKERYNKLLKDLGKQYGDVSEQSKKDTQTVAPADFAKGLITTATLPLAGGRLVNAGLAAKSASLASTTSRGALASAALAPAKVGLMYQPTAKAVTEIPGQIKKGDIKGAAGNAALLASPLLIAGAAKVLPKAAKAAGSAIYGKKGVLDEVIGADRLKAHLKEAPGDLAKLKQQELFTLDQPAVKSGKMSASEFLKQHYKSIGVDPKTTSVKQLIASNTSYFKQVEKLQKSHPELVVSHDFREALPKAIAAINKAGGPTLPAVEKVAVVQKALDEAKITNPTIKSLLSEALVNAEGKITNSDLNAITQKIVVPTKGTKLDKGFIATFGPKSKAALPSLDEASQAGNLTFGKKELPGFGIIGKFLQNTGLSTQSHNPENYGKFKTYLDNELKGLGHNTNEILDKINNYSVNHLGLYDERQLGTHALKQALGTSSSAEATAVKKAFLKAYSDMTWGELGAAGKIENALYKLPGYGQYRRIQGLGRYELNPFFRLQSGVEAEILSQQVSHGKNVNLPLTNTFKQIFRSNKIDRLEENANKVTKFLGEGYASSGAVDNSYGVITTRLTRTQKLSLGGLVDELAKKSGQNVDDFLKNVDQKTLNNIRSVVQYPQSGFTSSNFAKTLNLVAFPMRYNIKLATMAGKALADMPPLMQVGTLKALSDFSTFLNSDEGIKWQSDNSEVLGVINYLNPYNNINKILQGLKTGTTDISDFGLIGGLPLGIITQMVKTQTGVSTNKAYLNPKTGEVVPDKIPTNLAGRTKLAITDMINSMYSFPGRTFGMPSKSQATNFVTGNTLKTGKNETRDKEQALTAEQKRVQGILKKGSTGSQSLSVPTKRFATQYGNNPAPRLGNVPFSPAKAKAPKKGPVFSADGRRMRNRAVRPGQPF